MDSPKLDTHYDHHRGKAHFEPVCSHKVEKVSL